MNIPDRWIAKLDMLPPKDFKILVMAILRNESEPEITEKLQFIASDIYADIKQLQQTSERVRKSRSQRYSNVTVTVTETLRKRNSNSYSNSYSNVTETKEERKEGVPPCSPLPLPPTPPITNPPIIPPYQEKREEVTDSAGACEDEQIPFEGFEPLEPPESEVKRRKPTIAERFEALWEEYPKKNGKKNAFESYKRAIAAGVTDETIADGIRRYKDYIAAKRTSEQYILAGSTYFYQWRWQDIYDTNTAVGKNENGKPAWMSQEDWEEMNAVFG